MRNKTISRATRLTVAKKRICFPRDFEPAGVWPIDKDIPAGAIFVAYTAASVTPGNIKDLCHGLRLKVFTTGDVPILNDRERARIRGAWEVKSEVTTGEYAILGKSGEKYKLFFMKYVHIVKA